MLDKLVNGVDRGVRALSEAFAAPVHSYCRLETVDNGVLVADDGGGIRGGRLRMRCFHALFRIFRLRGVFSFFEDAHFITPRLQAQLAHAGSLIRAEQRGRTGTEKFSQTERQSADDYLGQAARVGALSLLLRGLVHLDGTP